MPMRGSSTDTVAATSPQREGRSSGNRESTLSDSEREALASCSGYVVEATDGRVGQVELPLFPPDRSEPDYLILRADGFLSLRRPLIATTLIEYVDTRERRIRVRGNEGPDRKPAPASTACDLAAPPACAGADTSITRAKRALTSGHLV
jgi:hypothetical protein